MTRDEARLPAAGWITCMLLLLCLAATMLATGEYLPKLGLPQPYYPTYLKFFAAQTLGALAAVAGAVWLAARKAGAPCAQPVWRRQAFAIVLGLYGAWTLASCLWAVWPYGAVGYAVREAWMYALCLLCYAAFASRRRMLAFAAVFALAATLAMGWQLIEVLVGYYGQAPDRPESLHDLFFRRPFLYGNVNFSCSQTICVGLLAASGVVVLLRWFTLEDPLQAQAPLIAGVLLCLLTVALAAVSLRLAAALAGYVAVAVAVAAYVLSMLPLRRPWAALGVAGVALLALLAASPRILRQVNDPGSTLYARGRVWWPATAAMFADRPIVGLGVGAYAAAYYRYAPPAGEASALTRNVQATHPHNEPLRIAAEEGLVGLALYVSVMAVALVVSWRRLMRVDFEGKAFGMALWAAAAAYIVQAAFGKEPMSWDFAVPFWMLLGALAAVSHWPAEQAEAGAGVPQPQAGEQGLRRQPARLTVWAVGVAAAVAAAATWQMWAWHPYVSMLRLTQAREAFQRSRQAALDKKMPYLQRTVEMVESARPRSPWPTEILKYDYMLGLTFTSMGEYDRALPILESIQKDVPACLETERLLGVCFLRRAARMQRAGDRVQAQALYRRGSDLLYSHIRRHPTATQAYRDLLESPPDQNLAHKLLADQVVRDGFADGPRVELLAAILRGRNAWDGLAVLLGQVEKAGKVDPVAAGIVGALARHYAAGDPGKLEDLRKRYPQAFTTSSGGG